MTVSEMMELLVSRYYIGVFKYDGYVIEVSRKDRTYIGTYYGITLEVALRNTITLLLG